VGRCSFLGELHSEEAGKFYRVIRMQINEPEERNLDDEDTDGKVVEESQMYVETMGFMKKTANSQRKRTEAVITKRLSSAKKSTPCRRFPSIHANFLTICLVLLFLHVLWAFVRPLELMQFLGSTATWHPRY